MSRLIISTIALCCMSLTLTACVTPGTSEGAGYSLLTPSAETASFIVANDKPFAKQVVAHNRQCRKDEACQK